MSTGVTLAGGSTVSSGVAVGSAPGTAVAASIVAGVGVGVVGGTMVDNGVAVGVAPGMDAGVAPVTDTGVAVAVTGGSDGSPCSADSESSKIRPSTPTKRA